MLQMGSYGLGMTRILGAAVESLSVSDGLRWPLAFAPYIVCIIPPKVSTIICSEFNIKG